MPSILKEPLLHFLLVGALVFALYSAVSPEQSQEDGAAGALPDQVIIIDQVALDRLDSGFQGVWRRPPTQEEAAGLLDAFITEEVLVREAQKLGLENGDSVVRQRLRLKMEFLIEGAVMPTDPGDAVLQAFLDKNAETYSVPGRVGFQQVYLGDRTTDDEIAAVLEALNSGAAPEALGQRTLLPAQLPLSSAQAVDGTFGTGVYASLQAVPNDTWFGPIKTGYGYHIVRIAERTETQALDLEEVREKLLQTWQEDQADLRKSEQIEALRSTYEVQLPNENGA